MKVFSKSGGSTPHEPPQQADSVHSNETPSNSSQGKKEVKTRRPPNSAFRQQRLKAWMPILTIRTVVPLYFAAGLVLSPIGGWFLYNSAKVKEIALDYSNCANEADETYADMPSKLVEHHFRSKEKVQSPQWKVEHNTTVQYMDSLVTVPDTTKCYLQFTIPEDMHPPVLLYYRLENFYQNHRFYLASFSANQLAGKAITATQATNSDCSRLAVNEHGKVIYPCGLIANSMFNDTILSPRVQFPAAGNLSHVSIVYPMSRRNIAWEHDKKLYSRTNYQPGEAVPPPHWARRWNYTVRMPDLTNDESFHVWMRTAGLPKFSKLAMRNDQETLKKGVYELEIWDEFNTTLYGGKKSILISTRTATGGRNPFMGIAYVIVGVICILLGGTFTILNALKTRKLGDDSQLSWNKARSKKVLNPPPADSRVLDSF
ncbi:Lem3/Cdc50 [Microthyrium microscopicum]|uniref:Lem3/Cdc50 n=1 Tax=Microthyrium microscopicum TaxID=703497 RepID=A0A6A6UD86_9PEZI|nr:Lem3/Cdc50 [Microthyrium microscopicum]